MRNCESWKDKTVVLIVIPGISVFSLHSNQQGETQLYSDADSLEGNFSAWFWFWLFGNEAKQIEINKVGEAGM